MSVEIKLFGPVPSLIELLSIPIYKRTQTDIDNIIKATSNFKFFKDLIEKDESASQHEECCKVLTIANYDQGDFICRKGDYANSFYLILKGRVKILAPPEIPINSLEDDELKKFARKNTDYEGRPARITHIGTVVDFDNNSEDGEIEKEIAELTSGHSFGEMALITDRTRYFSVKCVEDTILAILQKEDYLTIIKGFQEKQLLEKLEFLRGLEAFKSWSKLALHKLIYFFKDSSYKKGNIVYKEGDLPTDIYIIKSGEFLFTQQYSVNAGCRNSTNTFGMLKKVNQEDVIRKKNLKIVIKQKGDVFGYNEIYENKEAREFTCTCNSSSGQLILISDKNFSKKVSHPDTLKFIEEKCISFREWANIRLNTLKKTENFKDSVSFTPFSKIKAIPQRELINPEVKLPIILTPGLPPTNLPMILNKMLTKSRNKSYSTNRRDENLTFRSLFQTELNQSVIHKRKKSKKMRIFDASFSYSVASPSKMLPSSARKY